MLVKKTTVWDYLAIPFMGLSIGIVVCTLIGVLLPWIYKLSTGSKFEFIGQTSWAAAFVLGAIVAAGIFGASLIVTLIMNIIKTYYPEIIAPKQQGNSNPELRAKFLALGENYQAISKINKKSWNKKEYSAINHNNRKFMKLTKNMVFAFINESCIGSQKRLKAVFCLIQKRSHHGSYLVYTPVIEKNNGFMNVSSNLINKYGNVTVLLDEAKINSMIESKYFTKNDFNYFDKVDQDAKIETKQEVRQKEIKVKKVERVRVNHQHERKTSLKKIKIEK